MLGGGYFVLPMPRAPIWQGAQNYKNNIYNIYTKYIYKIIYIQKIYITDKYGCIFTIIL